MILVVGQLVLQIEQDDDTAGNSGGKTDDIQNAVKLVSSEQPDGKCEVIY
jgi:hypothetical protein